MERDLVLLPVTETDFEDAVLKSSKPALVDFSAEWCGPCRAIAPVIESLAVDYGDRVTVAKVDIDASPELAKQYGIRSVPTVVLLAEGEVRHVYVGAHPAQVYRQGIERLLQ